MVRIVDFADGFSSATAPDISGGDVESLIFTLLNNQSTFQDLVDLDGDNLIFNEIDSVSAFINFELQRNGSSNFMQVGSFVVYYDGADWTFEYGAFAKDDILQDSLLHTQSIQLGFDGGQLQYKSGNLSGHTSSEMRMIIQKVNKA